MTTRRRTAGKGNGHAGIELCATASVASLVANSDSWSICPPTQTAITCGSGGVVGYSDVVYSTGDWPAGGAISAPGCTVGP